jgi:hypothetical protein
MPRWKVKILCNIHGLAHSMLNHLLLPAKARRRMRSDIYAVKGFIALRKST